MPREDSPLLVAGLGNRTRKDDALGLIAIRRLQEHLHSRLPQGQLQKILYIEVGTSPIDYVQEISQSRLVLAVDAIQLGEKPGQVHRLSEKRIRELMDDHVHGISSHSFSFLDAVDLARKLTTHPRNPLHLIFYGIEPLDLGLGEELSDPVVRSLPALVQVISDFIAEILALS